MDGDPTRVRIIHAREESLADINGLIARSKSHWSWPEGYLDKALPLHSISPAYVRRNHCFEVLDTRDKLVAFFAVAVDGTREIPVSECPHGCLAGHGSVSIVFNYDGTNGASEPRATIQLRKLSMSPASRAGRVFSSLECSRMSDRDPPVRPVGIEYYYRAPRFWQSSVNHGRKI